MKRFFLFAACLVCFSQITKAADTTLVPAALVLTPLNEPTALEMIEEYDGWFRKHGRTDGLYIPANDLVSILQGPQFVNRTIAMVYGRRLTKETSDGKKRGRRVTILLVALKDGKSFLSDEYFDLGTVGRLCPEPRLCGITEN